MVTELPAQVSCGAEDLGGGWPGHLPDLCIVGPDHPWITGRPALCDKTNRRHDREYRRRRAGQTNVQVVRVGREVVGVEEERRVGTGGRAAEEVVAVQGCDR